MHKFHRRRVKQRFVSEGLENFSPHNIIELLLFYSVPQGDTNETAHRLMEKFGSLENIFDARIEDIVNVKGVGEHSAILMKLIPAVCKKYYEAKYVDEKAEFDYDEVGQYLTAKFVLSTREQVYIIFYDNKNRMISCDLISEGSVNSASFSFRKIAELALVKHASGFVLAHNHPNGIAIPSSDDFHTTKLLSDFVANLDLRFLEHYVVAKNKYCGILTESIL